MNANSGTERGRVPNPKTEQMTADFFKANPALAEQKEAILAACRLLVEVYGMHGKLLACGNGGSCADADHIVGELMKGFLCKRPLPAEETHQFEQLYGSEGVRIASKLQTALPALSLAAHSALCTAFQNDVEPDLAYAQQAMGYLNRGDALIGISTSGNSKNILAAVMTAKVKGAGTIGLTGRNGGKLKDLCDICILAPADETYRVQEYHLAIYHFICMYVEATFFDR